MPEGVLQAYAAVEGFGTVQVQAGARRLSERLNIPVYDVQKVGYPQRMRDYDARRRIERERAVRRELEDR